MNQTALGQFCWNELATTDVKKAKEFYGQVFGWQFDDLDIGDMGTYTIVKRENKEFAGIWSIPSDKPEIPPHWMAYILVDDVNVAFDKAKQYGAKEIKGVTNAGEMGKFAIITDPTGAHLALWEPSIKQ